MIKCKFRTISEFVDVETGEVLKIRNLNELKKTNYYLIKKNKTKEYDQKTGIHTIKYINECRRNRKQYELF